MLWCGCGVVAAGSVPSSSLLSLTPLLTPLLHEPPPPRPHTTPRRPVSPCARTYRTASIHNYLSKPSKLSRNDRVVQALGDIGPGVFLGVASTLVGVVPLAFANSEVFRVFFRSFLAVRVGA